MTLIVSREQPFEQRDIPSFRQAMMVSRHGVMIQHRAHFRSGRFLAPGDRHATWRQSAVTETALRLGCERGTLSRLLNGRAGVSANMALALEDIGWGTADHWMRMQASYDLAHARRRSATAAKRERNGRQVRNGRSPVRE